MDINEKRREIQLEAVTALEKNNFNGIVLLPTGTGKSFVMIESLKRLIDTGTINKIWYLCNSEDLRDKGFVEELKNWGAEDLIDNITRMCYQSACKIQGESVDVVLADEFDFSLSDVYRRVYQNNEIKHRILVSATIEKERLPIAKEIAPIVYQKKLQDIEENSIVNKSKYYFVKFMMTAEETKSYLWHNLKISNAINSNVSSERIKFMVLERKRFVNSLETSKNACRKLMEYIYKQDKENKVLIFCESNAQATAVCKYTYHSDTPEEDNLTAFKNGDFNYLSVCGKVNRGVNIPGVNNVIFESCNRSKTQLTQRLGRGKRLEVDKILNVYFLVPHFRQNGIIKPTKVLDWIYDAGRDIQFDDAVYYWI